MNHLITEPIESKTGDESVAQHGTANAETAAVSPTTVESAALAKPKTQPTFVPPLDPTVGIELRVTRAGIPARRLRINSTRCTFGSGEGCTVRLSDASLRPLHAVILRDGGRILIRGYSVPLEINGQHAVESFLALGDVVRLGQYCFELIDLPITDDDDRGYEDETVDASRSQTHLGASVENLLRPEHAGRDSAMLDIATEQSPSTDGAPNPQRLKFSQPASASRKNASRRSSSQSVLDGLQVSPVSVQISGGSDDFVAEEPVVREPITSLAQIHVQAKRNSELMADLAATRRREQEANEKLASTVDQLEAARVEITHTAQAADALRAEIAGLSVQVLKLSDDAKEQESIAAAEQAKLNRTIASLRESGAASQKAEAATRQALQESIRQRDDALGQRAVAIDAEQVTRAKLVEAEAQIRRLNQQAQENANLLTRFEAETEQARARIDELKDVCCGQADQITKLSTALETSQSQELATATRLNSAVEQLQAELNASRQLVRDADLERVQLHTLQSTLDSTLREHLAEKLSWDAHLAGMNQTLEQVSVELKTTTDELSRSRSEATSLQSQISEMRSLVANVEAELSLRPTLAHLQEVRSQLAQSESDYHNAEELLAQLREDYDQLASQRVAGQPVVADPALQPAAPAASLPMAVFPVPAVVDSMPDSEPAVEESHVADVEEIVASDAAAFASQRSESDSQAEVAQSASVSESSWKSPARVAPAESTGGWNVSQQEVTADGPLQPLPPSAAAKAGIPLRPETESQWLTSSHSRTEMMRDADEELPLHTEPMNRFSAESFSAAESLQPLDDPQLAAIIQRSEETTSNWFADYTAKRSDDEVPAEQDADDNAPVFAGLGQYVPDNDNPEEVEEGIEGAIDENRYDAMDPEASALSLARMLIDELDSATASDRDSGFGYGDQDPIVNSKRLVGAVAAEDEDSFPGDMRRKDFDERAFRDSFSGSTSDDVLDPNADEAVYSVQPESAQEPAFHSATDSATPSPAAGVEEEEDSVEAYMNQLLRRMGQEPLPAPAPAVAEPTRPATTKASSPKPGKTTSETPELIRPRRTAPELEAPMDQMRELANQSAESAISTSNRKGAKELRSKALVDGAQAGIIVVCALVFFYCGMTSSNLMLVWNTAGALALALSVFFFYEMVRKLIAASINR